ncbi:MAG: undecaprenyl-diphosphatase, partial [Armatimonadota bacterium]
MTLIEAIVLGIVQGLTEFIPISSTAHLRIVPALAGWSDPGAGFTAVIQLGTLLAVLVYFWKDLVASARGIARAVRSGERSPESRLGVAILVGTVPISVAGLLLKEYIEGPFRSLWIIAGTLVGVALILAVAEAAG